jgi:hypothetical protein
MTAYEPPPPPVTFTRSDVADMVRAHIQFLKMQVVIMGVPPGEADDLIKRIAAEEA